MTRKEAIKRLKRIQILSSSEAQEALSIAIRDLESLEGGIRCKALRKTGTPAWYHYNADNDEWEMHLLPDSVNEAETLEHIKECVSVPPDAVLVDIIIVTPKNE
jgi:hypothetical protein